MGIKQTITKSQLPLNYQKYNLIPTTNGVMATVYLLDDIYVLKLFEKDIPLDSIENEIELLNSLKDLPTPKVIDRFRIDGFEVVIYTQIKGEIILNPTLKQIELLGAFLRDFHKQSQNLQSKNQELFTKERLKSLIELTQSDRLLREFNSIDLSLKRDGVIHGDLFMDNCKFLDSKLSGVFDFSDACVGNFGFDLAVVAIGCCFDEGVLNIDKLEALFMGYGDRVNMDYIRYALLYYATTRFLGDRNYMELLDRLDRL